MKGIVFTGDSRLELREFPDPSPGPGEVVLEIKASGMCGSDLKLYRAPAGRAGAGSIFRRFLDQYSDIGLRNRQKLSSLGPIFAFDDLSPTGS